RPVVARWEPWHGSIGSRQNGALVSDPQRLDTLSSFLCPNQDGLLESHVNFRLNPSRHFALHPSDGIC
ncbi:MAG: hypothetical protein WCQ64_09535, partial [Acidobacteriota bacterium]